MSNTHCMQVSTQLPAPGPLLRPTLASVCTQWRGCGTVAPIGRWLYACQDVSATLCTLLEIKQQRCLRISMRTTHHSSHSVSPVANMTLVSHVSACSASQRACTVQHWFEPVEPGFKWHTPQAWHLPHCKLSTQCTAPTACYIANCCYNCALHRGGCCACEALPCNCKRHCRAKHTVRSGVYSL